MSVRSRSRLFSSVLYCSTSQLDIILSKINSLAHYAYILHDLEDCEPHIHLLTYYLYQRDRSAVLRELRPSDNSNVLTEVGSSKTALFAYLTHEDKPDKYQYPFSSIVSDSIDFWSSEPFNISDNTLSILEDINSNVSFRKLVQRYGRDFVIHYYSYKYAAELLKDDDNTRKHQRSSPLTEDNQLEIPFKKK